MQLTLPGIGRRYRYRPTRGEFPGVPSISDSTAYELATREPTPEEEQQITAIAAKLREMVRPRLNPEMKFDLPILAQEEHEPLIEDLCMDAAKIEQNLGEKDGDNGVSPLTRPHGTRTAAYLLGYAIGKQRRAARHLGSFNDTFQNDRMYNGSRRLKGGHSD
jgi:hypothetical protein